MVPRRLKELTILDFIHNGWWWRNTGILLLNLCLILPLLTSAVNGLDSSLLNGLQILPDWQTFYNHPTGIRLGLINSAQAMGQLVGQPFSPYASDIIGRRGTLFAGSIVMLGGVALQIAAPNIKFLIGARALIGLGLAFTLNAAPLLLIELAYPTQRGKISSLYNSSWYFGSIVSAWVCLGTYTRADGTTWSWRAPTILQALVPFLQVCLVWFIPESPRFLVSKGFEGRAARILCKYHANGSSERDPLVVFEIAQIRHALRMEEEINRTTSYMSLLKTPGNRKRMILIVGIAICSQWSGNGLISYYINIILEGVGISDTYTKAAINGGLQVFNFVVAVTAAMLVDKIGRRKLFIASNTGMLIVFSMWTLTTALFTTSGNTSAAKATIPLIFLFFAAYDIAYTPLLVAYTLEILPYKIRAKGFAIMNVTVNLASAFNQFFNPWALDRIGWKYYIVYCCWLAIELAFILSRIKETRGRTLEETAAVFDSEENQKDLAALGGDAATMLSSSNRDSPLLDRHFMAVDSDALPTKAQDFELRVSNRSSRSGLKVDLVHAI